jgi:hypothetical protein
MMNQLSDSGELSFSADFAARIITEADAIRRRRRVAGYGGLTLLVASVVTAGVLFTAPGRHAAPAPVVASISNPRVDFSPNLPTDPLQFLFPEAAPVAKFASSYSEQIYGRQRQPGELLFADETQETGDL